MVVVAYAVVGAVGVVGVGRERVDRHAEPWMRVGALGPPTQAPGRTRAAASRPLARSAARGCSRRRGSVGEGVGEGRAEPSPAEAKKVL